MNRLHLDTHVIVWLHAGAVEKLPPKARQLLESEVLCCSPIVVLELQTLFESGRVTQPAVEVISLLERRVGLVVTETKASAAVSEALGIPVSDVFDRLIAAEAALEKAQLLTKNEEIRKHYPRAVWD
ncbi:MAG: PIN domain-containing protein [Deltaproteobacteria bacterium]|nr:PIN domain-containing protein [Deltaproteobacteria bacterium]